MKIRHIELVSQMKGPKQEQDTSKIITILLSLITSSISLARHNESSVKKNPQDTPGLIIE